MGTRKIVVGEGGGKAGARATAGATVARAAACLPLQCPPNIMMPPCDVRQTRLEWSRGGAEDGAASRRCDSGAAGEPSAPDRAARWRCGATAAAGRHP